MRIFFACLAWMLFAASFMLALTGGYMLTKDGSWRTRISPLLPKSGTPIAIKQADGRILGSETAQLNNELIIDGQDARPLLVANFLERHQSPMQPYDEYGYFFVDLADRYAIDFRLLPSIAMQESNLCKVIPEGSHNCLGLGIHARGTWGFDSYRENFEAAAKILKKNYIDIGLTTPEQIMRKYTPSSDGSWANSVNQWMAEMRYDDRALGRALKQDASVVEFAQPTLAPTPSN